MIPQWFSHFSVMVEEAMAFLDVRPGSVVVDGTLGGGGHAMAMVRRMGEKGSLVGIDRDTDALKAAKQRLGSKPVNIHLVHGNFADMPQILQGLNIKEANGVLLDLGMSFFQLRQSGRGFSFQKDEPLDMRMDMGLKKTAAHLLATCDERELAQILKQLGEEPQARRIARRIVETRRERPVETSAHLASLVEAVKKKALGRRKIHPATQTFMALRMAVNQELEALDRFLDGAMDILAPKGRLVIISFHSLEDRRVKQAMKTWENPCTCPPKLPVCVCGKKPVARMLTRKPAMPSAAEIRQNPLSRSARLRAAERLERP